MDDESGGYSVGRRKVKISRRTSAESLSILTLGVDLIANALMLFSIRQLAIAVADLPGLVGRS